MMVWPGSHRQKSSTLEHARGDIDLAIHHAEQLSHEIGLSLVEKGDFLTTVSSKKMVISRRDQTRLGSRRGETKEGIRTALQL